MDSIMTRPDLVSSATAASLLSLWKATSHFHSVSKPDSWISCEKARSSTGSVRTWVDGYPRVNVSVISKPCPRPTPITTHITETVQQSVWPSFTSITNPCFPDPLPCIHEPAQSVIYDEGKVEIIYWPVTLGSSKASTFTVPPTQKGMVTAEYYDATFTSPTIYLRYPTLWAAYGASLARSEYLVKSHLNSDGQRTFTTSGHEYIFDRLENDVDTGHCFTSMIGKTYSNIIIPVPTSFDLSTFQHRWMSGDRESALVRKLSPSYL